MFSRQAPQINQNLWQGGLSAAQASVIANALGQCRAPLVHRAPVTVDYTSPDMRLIDASAVNVKFPDIAIQPPEVPPPKPQEPPEEEPPVEPNPLPPKDPIGPVQPPPGAPGGPSPGDGGGWAGWQALYKQLQAELNDLRQELADYKASNPGYTGGDYIDVDSNTSRIISLNTESNDKGFICTFGTDEIVGTDIADLIDDNADKILQAIKDENSGNVANQVSVITGVSLTGSGLEFRTKTISVIEGGTEGTGPTIPITDCNNP